jgi:hypothetical protein
MTFGISWMFSRIGVPPSLWLARPTRWSGEATARVRRGSRDAQGLQGFPSPRFMGNGPPKSQIRNPESEARNIS